MSIAPPPIAAAPEAPDAAGYRAPATDLLAMLAMIASVVGLTAIPGLGSIAGIVLGGIALRRTAAPDVGGRPLALWGLILGIVGLVAVTAVAVIAVVGFAAVVGSMPPVPAP